MFLEVHTSRSVLHYYIEKDDCIILNHMREIIYRSWYGKGFDEACSNHSNEKDKSP